MASDFLGVDIGDDTSTNADMTLDLSAMAGDEAIAKLEDALTRWSKSSVGTALIQFDVPEQGHGETLFQPLAKTLIAKKSTGILTNFMPVMNDNRCCGFLISFAL